MARPQIRGKQGPIPQIAGYTYDPKYGFQTQEKQTGTVNAMLGLSATLRAYGIPHALRTTQDGFAEVEISSPFPSGVDPKTEKPIDTYQITGSQIEKDIYEHPSLIQFVQNGKIKDLRNAVTNQDSTKLTDVTLQSFYNLIVGGVTSFSSANYVVRHTQTVSNQYTSDLPDVNVNRIYTADQLIAELNAFNTPPPVRFVNKIKNLAPDFPVPNLAQFLWGYLKLPSTETTIGNNKIEITNDYILECWSIVIYKRVQ